MNELQNIMLSEKGSNDHILHDILYEMSRKDKSIESRLVVS